MKKRGWDLSGHLSSRVTSALEDSPDLILVMARQHLRSLFELDKTLLGCAFTLKEFVRLGEAEGQRLPGEGMSEYLARVRAGRGVPALLFGSHDDIADPMGRRKRAYKRCAGEIEELTSRLASVLYPGSASQHSADEAEAPNA